MTLSGRRILVTGAASGIGRATAILISQLSGKVACIDRDQEGLQQTLASLQGEGHTAMSQDLSLIDEISSWMADLAAHWGKLHAVVHAAGVPCIQPLRMLIPAAYRDGFRINTEAALALTRAFQSQRIYQGEGGSVVFISSIMALVGSPAAVGYSMSKAALIGMARSLAVELAPKKIRVNCVAPGFVRTPMLDKISKTWDQASADRVAGLHPLGLGEPGDVANAIAFLLADTSRWITGSVLTVDGGYTAQ